MRPLERLLFSWRWRARRIALPSRTRGRDQSAYGYAIPRDGVPPAAIVAIALAAIVIGGVLGSKTGGAQPSRSAVDLLASPAPATSASGGAQLRQVITGLSGARLQGRNDLASAKSPSEQAAAALELRSAYLRAVVGLRGAQPPVVAALQRTAAAYGALELAAEKSDRAGFARAATNVESAERDLQRLIGSTL